VPQRHGGKVAALTIRFAAHRLESRHARTSLNYLFFLALSPK
jgi:hypothetical protein